MKGIYDTYHIHGYGGQSTGCKTYIFVIVAAADDDKNSLCLVLFPSMGSWAT